jgi:4-amino-4-deoxychorismate lyase
MLVNGQPSDLIPAEDRGLSYGDGVFRTLSVSRGSPLFWQRHYRKLHHDCAAIRITCPAADQLLSELKTLCKERQDCIAKIIITRGVGTRGYAPSSGENANRILSSYGVPKYNPDFYTSGVILHACSLKLGHQPILAGIKHLNRLENVLAAEECQAVGTPEGMLEDDEGLIISGTRSNLFALRGGTLYTPDLSRCGVSGVQRDRVMSWANAHGVTCKVTRFHRDELLAADEIFLVNSVFGLWPVQEVAGYQRKTHPVAWQIQHWLNDENNC